jgi:hypothetical protein
MIFGAIGRMKIGRGTEVLGENLPQRHFVHHKIPHNRPGLEPQDRSGGKPATNHLSYGAALNHSKLPDQGFIPFAQSLHASDSPNLCSADGPYILLRISLSHTRDITLPSRDTHLVYPPIHHIWFHQCFIHFNFRYSAHSSALKDLL